MRTNTYNAASIIIARIGFILAAASIVAVQFINNNPML